MPWYDKSKSQIVMLGGRRSGKSTILSSIVESIKRTDGNLFTVLGSDVTVDNRGGLGVPLEYKRRELAGFMVPDPTRQGPFIVDMSSNQGRSIYTITIRRGNNADATFDFLDVPGEDMQQMIITEDKDTNTKIQVRNPNYDDLNDKMASTDVVIIAIDTPYLMEALEDVNRIYNRIDEIEGLTNRMITQNDRDKKMIILCPVKCEKWINNGRIEEVTQRTLMAYRNVINAHVQDPNFEIWIMPLATAGGIESCKLLPGYQFQEIEGDASTIKTGSIDPFTGQIYSPEGRILSENEVFRIDKTRQAKELKFDDYLYVPLSWYRTNGSGYSPQFCEQPAYHIIRFLARKKHDNPNFFGRFFNFFGNHLQKYLDMIDEMERKNMIKTSGDGFYQVRNIIQ